MQKSWFVLGNVKKILNDFRQQKIIILALTWFKLHFLLGSTLFASKKWSFLERFNANKVK